LIPAAVMSELNRRTSLVTISLGSGAGADVIFLFTSDISGESDRTPRRARTWSDLSSLRRAIRDERIKALSGFRSAVASGAFPAASEIAGIADAELAPFRARLDASGE
jgi:3-methyl-2-oxobutanoate hydroxymethyltransferase